MPLHSHPIPFLRLPLQNYLHISRCWSFDQSRHEGHFRQKVEDEKRLTRLALKIHEEVHKEGPQQGERLQMVLCLLPYCFVKCVESIFMPNDPHAADLENRSVRAKT